MDDHDDWNEDWEVQLRADGFLGAIVIESGYRWVAFRLPGGKQGEYERNLGGITWEDGSFTEYIPGQAGAK